MYCYSFKQHIDTPPRDSSRVSEINQILASNLAHFMGAREVTQAELAKRAGIGQTTVSLYLNPASRLQGATGKTPSPTLAKVESLARALDAELWELLRPLSPVQRELYRSIEKAFQEAVRNAVAPSRLTEQAIEQARIDSREIRPAKDVGADLPLAPKPTRPRRPAKRK